MGDEVVWGFGDRNMIGFNLRGEGLVFFSYEDIVSD